MWKTNNPGRRFPQRFSCASFPFADGNYKDAMREPSRLAIATLRMYRPICKQSSLHSRDIIFSRYLSFGHPLSSSPLAIAFTVSFLSFFFTKGNRRHQNRECIANIALGLLLRRFDSDNGNDIYACSVLQARHPALLIS